MRNEIKQHKPGCMANVACAVLHDGPCPGPYGKCTCDETKADVPSPQPKEESFKQILERHQVWNKDLEFEILDHMENLLITVRASTLAEVRENIKDYRYETTCDCDCAEKVLKDILSTIEPKS